jgi:anti-sigma-K factor RskA
MAERHEPQLPHEQAEHYLFGRLTPAERQAFEARLEQSAELRALVRELEAGLVALALSAPARVAPADAWQNIQTAVARQQRWQQPLVWARWLTNGWAVATCLIVAFSLHLFWVRRIAPVATIAGNEPMVQPVPEPNTLPSVFAQIETNASILIGQNLLPTPPTTNELQMKIAQLESQLATLKQAAVPPPTNAPKGLQLVPQPTRVANHRTRLSPRMQQTLLLAVAHQLGWGNSSELPSANSTGHETSLLADGTGTPNVDFVDLPAPGESSTPPALIAANSLLDHVPADPGIEGDPTVGGVPMLAWEKNILALIDPSTLTSVNGPLTVWSVDGDGNQLIVGTVAVSGNPTVVTLPDANIAGGQQYFITVGPSNMIIGQFPQP